MFWMICIAMALVVAAVLAAPLLRSSEADTAPPEMAIYKGQLAEVDRDVERGVLNANEADRARTEISRRLLASARADRPIGTAPLGLNKKVAAGMTAALLLLAIVVYADLGAPGEPDQPLAARLADAEAMRNSRPAQAALEAAAPAPLPVDAPADYLEQIAQLRMLVPTRPDDLQGWTLLAYHETQLRNYAAAAVAQARIVALKGDAVTDEDLQMQADLLISAANGVISPEAEAVARTMVARDEASIPGRYYLGALYDQTGRPDIAFRIWRPLVESGDASFHSDLARAQIESAAARAGVEYRLPDTPGPAAADIAAAQDMSEEDRQAMIGGMVNRLADRLSSQGGPAPDWARLISAYGVLGDKEAAAAVWAEAQQTFKDDAAAIQALQTAAQSAGLIE